MGRVDQVPGQVLFFVIVTAAVAIGIWRARNRPRFIVDEHGERQRVMHWSRGQPVYTPTTWRQRVHEEAMLRAGRRWAIILSAPFVIGPSYLFYRAHEEGSFLLGAGAGWLLVELSLPVALLWFIPNVLNELRYQSGYQGMQGAKVLDRQPAAPPGRELVETQKAHGDARLAGEAEALSLLNSKS